MELLKFLPQLYPNADAWLEQRLTDVERGIARCTVAILPDRRGLIGVTIETPKPANSLKLSTIYVCEQYQRNGVGAALLRRARRQWIAARLQAVHVTVDAGRRHLLEPLLLSNGFDLTAIDRDRYTVGRDELVFHWDRPLRQVHHRAMHLPAH
jgi:GNAT superfamily N-acetyltransferase